MSFHAEDGFLCLCVLLQCASIMEIMKAVYKAEWINTISDVLMVKDSDHALSKLLQNIQDSGEKPVRTSERLASFPQVKSITQDNRNRFSRSARALMYHGEHGHWAQQTGRNGETRGGGTTTHSRTHARTHSPIQKARALLQPVSCYRARCFNIQHTMLFTDTGLSVLNKQTAKHVELTPLINISLPTVLDKHVQHPGSRVHHVQHHLHQDN